MDSLYEFGLFLNSRAHWTQNFIYRSNVLRLGILEETITDMHLFSIADKYANNVITRKFNRREEGSQSGADWLWIIGEPGSWLPLLIQAKVINLKTQKCQHFDYKNGEQRKRLLKYARLHGCLPLYCIYSYIPPDFIPPEQFIRADRSNEDWACSFLSPRSVRELSQAGIKSQKEVLKYCIPWMEPFCSDSSKNSSKGEAIAAAFTNIRDKFAKSATKELVSTACTKKLSLLKKRISWENLDATPAVRTEIPSFICSWFKANSTINLNVPLSEVSIISTTPIAEISELQK